MSELTKFVAAFDESVSLLTSLNIPDLGSFILLSLASMVLPFGVRKLFEVENSDDHPSFQALTQFLKSRISILENVTESRKPVQPGKSPVNHFSSRSRKLDKSYAVAFTVTKTDRTSPNNCKCCDNNSHTLSACKKFASWFSEDRIKLAQTNRLCFLCLSDKHWFNRCGSTTKCTLCSRKHHSLLHPKSVHIPSGGADPQSSVSIPCASTSLVGEHSTPSVN